MLCLFTLSWANLKSCSEKHDELAICLNENNLDPFPMTVYTNVYLNEIIGIDHDKNSISVGVTLWAEWADPRLSVTNNIP